MSLDTTHKFTFTESQSSIILYILEDYISKNNVSKIDPDLPKELDTIFEELEGVVDKYYTQLKVYEEEIKELKSALNDGGKVV